MFTISKEILSPILADFGISAQIADFTELQRYHYEKEDPASKEVRLIVKVQLADGRALVARFKNEADVTRELVDAQSRFARLLAAHGVETPAVYSSHGQYARWYAINGYDVIVTVEDFVCGELRAVTPEIAGKTGALLARMHNIAESAQFHVQNSVLFDPLGENDLFSFEVFAAQKAALSAVDKALYEDIARECERLMQKVRLWESGPKYAVQGDISDCNLYQTASGRIGVFDFNRCGDAVLYYDAVMQAIFEARLMDYPEELAGRQEVTILPAFLQGYHRERPFSRQQRESFPDLYALVSAFWLGDMKWNENSLCRAVEAQNAVAMRQWMEEIHRRLCSRREMPL